MSTVTTYLPDILTPANKAWSSISVFRALKHIKTVLEEQTVQDSDELQVAFDDLDVMMQAIALGRKLEERNV